jgi:hypothetical protein
MSNDVLGLIEDVRQLSALKRNKFYTDTDIAKMLSDASSELYDLVVGSFENYFRKTFDFTLTGTGASSVLLPRDFYKEQLLEVNPTSPYPQTVKMLSNFALRNRGAGQLLENGSAPREFVINGDTLDVLPPQNSAGNYRLTYVPQLEELVIPQQVSLDIVYTPAPVNVTVRAASSRYFDGPEVAPLVPIGTWTTTADAMTLVVPVESGVIQPISVDGVDLAIGDIFLVQKPDAPGNGYHTFDPLNMGLWTYNGVQETGQQLNYTFGRLANYQGQDFASGFVIPPGLRVKVTEGSTWAGAILVSQAQWTVHTNSVDFALATDQPITVQLMTTSPLTGAWTQVNGNSIYLLDPDDADTLKIDGEQLATGDLVWFTFDDAPLTPTNMGVWRYDGPLASGAIFYQSFTRPTSLLAGNSVVGGQNVYVNNGVTLRGATFRVPQRITLGTTNNVALLPLNYIDATSGVLELQNAEIDPSYVGGTVLIEGSPFGTRSYRIKTYTDETSAILEAIDDALVSESFGKPTTLNLTQADSRSTLPAAMNPWLLYIKVHASIAIRTGRQQDTSALEAKLSQERGRIIALAANRQEDVTQAPITRWRRGRYGYGGYGG